MVCKQLTWEAGQRKSRASMLSLPASLARAFAQLADPRILWLLIKSLLVTLLLFVALVFLRTQTEIRARRTRALLAREQRA